VDLLYCGSQYRLPVPSTDVALRQAKIGEGNIFPTPGCRSCGVSA
jgi:hypothetical protein